MQKSKDEMFKWKQYNEFMRQKSQDYMFENYHYFAWLNNF